MMADMLAFVTLLMRPLMLFFRASDGLPCHSLEFRAGFILSFLHHLFEMKWGIYAPPARPAGRFLVLSIREGGQASFPPSSFASASPLRERTFSSVSLSASRFSLSTASSAQPLFLLLSGSTSLLDFSRPSSRLRDDLLALLPRLLSLLLLLLLLLLLASNQLWGDRAKAPLPRP